MNYSNAELKKLAAMWQKAKDAAKNSATYKGLIERRYPNPQGYTPWEIVASEVAAVIQSASSVGLANYEPIGLQGVTITAQFLQEAAPVYWIHESLAETFWNTDLPEQLPQLKRSVPTLALMLPEADWLASPTYGHPRYLIARHILQDISVPDVILPRGQRISTTRFSGDFLQWAVLFSTGAIFSKSVKLFDNSLEYSQRESKRSVKININTHPDYLWASRITHLLYQALLVMQLQPNFIDAVESISSRTGDKPGQTERTLKPRWIGSPEVDRKVSRTGRSNKPHSSPITHWRRGHWKRVAVGKGGRDRKIMWIQPTLVNSL